MASTADDQSLPHHIGEVSARVGLSLRTIRHYDEVGLVSPSGRSAGGFRLYTDEDVERLELVKHMKPLDFSLAEMRELLEVRDRLATTSETTSRTALLDRLLAYAAVAENRCEKLRHDLAAAESMASMLRREARRRTRTASSR